MAIILAGCRQTAAERAIALTGGNPARGRDIIARTGCGSCHTIAGVPGATATVGPPLSGLMARHYIAGVLPNTPDNLVRWIVDPPAVDSLTAMPNVGLDTAAARDVAAYLYMIR